MLEFYCHAISRLALRDNKRFNQDEGASAVEYGMLVAAIAAVIAATVIGLGGRINNMFNSVVTAIGGIS